MHPVIFRFSSFLKLIMATSRHFNVFFTGKHIVKADSNDNNIATLSLSNFDLLAGRSPVAVFYAYPNPLSADFTSVITKILTSLQRTLTHFFPFAGRLVSNPNTGEPEILCNNEGVEVIEARAEIDLASLDFYDPTKSLQNNLVPQSQDMPLRLQVTSFSCGGFSIAWSLDHGVADATGFSMFVVSWSEIALMKPISMYPNHQRSVFKPRSPLKYASLLDSTYSKCTMEQLRMNATATPLKFDISVKRTYMVEASDIIRLQKEASESLGHQDHQFKATKLEAFSAHLWKLLATSIINDEDDYDGSSHHKKCQMGWLVEGRRRMVSYDKVSNLFGNLLSMAVGEATTEELKQGTSSSVARIVHDAIAKVANEEHFKDLVDWVEDHRPGMFLAKMLLGMNGTPGIVISSAVQVPVRELDFGFGAPVIGSQYSIIPRLGAGYVSPQPSGRGDGSWVVFVILWPEFVKVLESDPDCVFKPITTAHLGLKS